MATCQGVLEGNGGGGDAVVFAELSLLAEGVLSESAILFAHCKPHCPYPLHPTRFPRYPVIQLIEI